LVAVTKTVGLRLTVEAADEHISRTRHTRSAYSRSNRVCESPN
jgi:hypothetical protein